MSAIALAATGPADLQCKLGVPARVAPGQPVPLRITVMNRGPARVQVLNWGTPFEGWFAPFVVVRRDGAALPYRGPAVKRGDPARDEYLGIAPGRRRSAKVDLAAVFDLSRPGRYRVEPSIVLHDVIVGGGAAPPRPRAQHVAQPLDCDAVEFDVRSGKP